VQTRRRAALKVITVSDNNRHTDILLFTLYVQARQRTALEGGRITNKQGQRNVAEYLSLKDTKEAVLCVGWLPVLSREAIIVRSWALRQCSMHRTQQQALLTSYVHLRRWLHLSSTDGVRCRSVHWGNQPDNVCLISAEFLGIAAMFDAQLNTIGAADRPHCAPARCWLLLHRRDTALSEGTKQPDNVFSIPRFADRLTKIRLNPPALTQYRTA
jgi:hypothetical protein